MGLKLEGFGLEIDVGEIEDLHPHEETIPGLKRCLKLSFRLSKVQRDPIIVDRRSGVIIDGMHRTEVLREIGCDKALICYIDYDDEGVRIERWARILIGPLKGLDSFIRYAKMERVDRDRAKRLVDEGERPFALFTERGAFVSNLEFSDSHDAYTKLHEAMELHGLRFRAVPLNPESVEPICIYPLCVSKEEVKRYGSMGMPFPPKSTRHILPYRPVNVLIPIDLLSSGRGIGEGRAWLERTLAGSGFRVLPRGTSYRGRVYYDNLLVFKRG